MAWPGNTSNMPCPSGAQPMCHMSPSPAWGVTWHSQRPFAGATAGTRPPAATALAESKTLRPGHVALESLVPPCAVCRVPVRCAGAHGCPAPAPPRSVTAAPAPGRPPLRWHPLQLGTAGGGHDVTMKQPRPACHAAGDGDCDGATTCRCTPAACMGCGGEGAGT